MSNLRLLLLINSTMAGEKWLGWPEGHIVDFLDTAVTSVFFIPFAGVRLSWDDYARQARERFGEMGYGLVSAHEATDPLAALEAAGAVVVGGGNTYHLLNELYARGLLLAIRKRVLEGLPYVGWSAGSNVACPTIMTTNDMPVVEPPSFKALGLLPVQINPHFTDAQPPGLAGETRTDRLMEFIEVNPQVTVVGLPEGDLLHLEGYDLQLVGSHPARIFKKGKEPWDVQPGDPLDFLLS